MHYGSSLSLTQCSERIKVLNDRTLIGYSGEFSSLKFSNLNNLVPI